MILTRNHIDLYKMIMERGIGRACNDLDSDELAMLTIDQWQEFNKSFHDWNGDPEEYNEQWPHSMMDFMVVSYINHLLLQSYVLANPEAL